jgi:ADP-heptose:LPS heptosyltransferase
MARQRVLVLQLKRVGDVLLCTPLLRALREDAPGRRVAFLTEEPNREVLRGNPSLDAILTVPARMGATEWRDLRRRLREEAFDLAVDCSGTPRSCLVTALTRARERVGFRVRLPRRLAYNRLVVPDRSKYTVDRRLDLLRSIGIPDRGLAPELTLDPEDWAEADRLLAAAGLRGAGPLLAVAPTSRKEAKRWPPEAFAALAARAHQDQGAQILLLRGDAEEDQEEEVRRALGFDAPRLPEVPRLRVLAALIGRSRVLLANDGGPKHLAVALGIPTVTAFVSTAASSWHPPGDPRHVAIEARRAADGGIQEAREALRRMLSEEHAP